MEAHKKAFDEIAAEMVASGLAWEEKDLVETRLRYGELKVSGPQPKPCPLTRNPSSTCPANLDMPPVVLTCDQSSNACQTIGVAGTVCRRVPRTVLQEGWDFLPGAEEGASRAPGGAARETSGRRSAGASSPVAPSHVTTLIASLRVELGAQGCGRTGW